MRARPVSAKALAARHGLPPRHLEPVLQALVHEGILRGIRGPRGGYELGREQRRITAAEILRAAGTSTRTATASQRLALARRGGAAGARRRPSAPSRLRWRSFASTISARRAPRICAISLSLRTTVHGLDSYGSTPVEGKVTDFAGRPLADRRPQRHAGTADNAATSDSGHWECGHDPGDRRRSADPLRSMIARRRGRPVLPSPQPSRGATRMRCSRRWIYLDAFARSTGTNSRRSALTLGVMLFAVVTAIMLVRTRRRADAARPPPGERDQRADRRGRPRQSRCCSPSRR